MKSFIRGILLSLALVFVFTTCENPVGLGTKVNTEKPVIKTPDDAERKPGDFLHGIDNKIWLEVEQEFGIDHVYIEVEYSSISEGKTVKKRVPASYDEKKNQWYVNLDTTDMVDGKISAWVTAVDVDGNKTTTTDIIYTVKNLFPQIKLNIPEVSENDFDIKEKLDNLVTTDIVYQGLDLMGIATDAFKIADGFPKIMFWPEDNNLYGFPVDDDGIPTDNKWGQWRTVELPQNYQGGSEVVRFSWPMADLIEDESKPVTSPDHWRKPERLENGKYGDEFVSLTPNKVYRFRIWVRDGFGKDNYYPNRTDNKRGPNGTPLDPKTAERKYIPVYYKSIGDQAIVQVPEMKMFYNRAGDFEVNFVVLSGKGMKTADSFVEAKISDDYDGTFPRGTYYAVRKTGSNPYEYTLTITKEQAALWGNREGRYYLKLTATDDVGVAGPVESKYFDLDLTPPEVNFDQPVVLTNKFKSGDITGGKYTILYPSANTRPKWVTATVTTGGKSTDAYGIDKVYYHLGKHNDDKMSDTDLKAFYEDDKAKALDGSDFWKDTGLGTANMAENWSGSVYAWTYTQAFPKNYKINYPAQVQALSDLGGGPYTPVDWFETVGERFYLPLYVKVVDQAGNRQIVHYKLSVDPDLDDPQVTFIYPKENDIVGGTVRMSGTAEDNTWMHSVLMRIHKDGDGGNNPADADYWYIPTTVPKTLLFYEQNPSFVAKPSGVDVPEPLKGWFKLTNIAGEGAVVNWSSTVNGDGGLNPAPDVDTVDVKIDVVAIDATSSAGNPRAAGPVYSQIVKFSSKVPLIEDINIYKNKGTTIENKRVYDDNMSTSGIFVMTMKISAVQGIYKLLAKAGSNPQVTLITNNSVQVASNDPVWSVTSPTATGSNNRYVSELEITIDSTTLGKVGGIGYGKTDIFNIEITVEDNTESKFTTTRNFKIGIDNFYPSAEIETSVMASDNVAANKFFYVQGTAKDWGDGSGALQGLERVLVYFEEAKITYTNTTSWTGRKVVGNQKMRKPDGSTAAAGSADFVEYPNVMDASVDGFDPKTTVPNKPSGFSAPKLIYNETTKLWTSPAGMVIDAAENDPKEDTDKDGTYGERWAGLTDKIWQARMMISNFAGTNQQFPDGPYIIHYLVMDTAGNATHYQKDIYVENNKPLITNINIGTDINFDDAVAYPGEYRASAYQVNNTSESTGSIATPESEFRIRNKRFGISVTQEKGNGNKTARVTYVTRDPTPIDVTQMKRGHVYQIATNASITDFTEYGSPNGYQGTVFIASCPGEGDPLKVAKVYQFTNVSTQTLSLGTVTGTAQHAFTSFDNVPDISQGMFILKVYDTTVSDTSNGSPVDPEFDQLSQAVLLYAAVNNTDNISPQIEVANFGRRHLADATGTAQKYEDNKLTKIADAVYTDYVVTTGTTGTTKNGYVQYQAHSSVINTGAGSDNADTGTNGATSITGNGGTANISGKVIFNGKVNDNHRINRITVLIPGYTSGELEIANRDSTTKLLKPTNTTTGEREFKLVYDNDKVPQFSLAYGQTVVWQFMWDSSKINNAAQSNVDITFRVYDETSSATSIKNVNIVPYISKITTPLSGANKSAPSAFNRSALGGYPVREGDEITIEGFNFGTATTNVAYLNNTTIGTVTNNGTSITGNIPAAGVSGALEVRVNGITSFNNSASKTKTAAYNKEPNNVNNNILDNARYMYVWTAGYMLNKSTADITSPFFRMDPATGVRYIAHGFYGTYDAANAQTPMQSSLRMLINNGNGRAWDDTTSVLMPAGSTNPRAFGRQLATTQNRYISITSAIGTNGEFYVLSSNQTQGGSPFRLYTSGALAPGTPADPAVYAFELSGTSNPGRFEIPRIWAKNSGTGTAATDARRVIASYFDNDDGNLYFRYGSRGSSTATTATAGNNANWTGFAQASVTTTASKYSAVGALSNGRPVIAYYNGSSLTFAYGNAIPSGTTHPNGGGANNIVATPSWTTVTIPDSASKGAHVDLAVDAGNNVHLAYYNVTDGGLYYLLIPVSNDGTSVNTNNLVPVQVDTYLSAGTKLMINVRQDNVNGTNRYVPYITYFHGSFSETRNSIRVAWRKEFTANVNYNGTDEEDMFTGKWEVMTVPAINTPVATEIICNGLPTVTGAQTTGARWVDVNTHGTGGTPLLRNDVNLNQSIVIGYMTNAYYEGAILKGNMTTTPTELQK